MNKILVALRVSSVVNKKNNAIFGFKITVISQKIDTCSGEGAPGGDAGQRRARGAAPSALDQVYGSQTDGIRYEGYGKS